MHLLLDCPLLFGYGPPPLVLPIRLVVLAGRVDLHVIFRTIFIGPYLDLLVAAVAISDPVNRSHRLDLARLHETSVLCKHVFVLLWILELLTILLL